MLFRRVHDSFAYNSGSASGSVSVSTTGSISTTGSVTAIGPDSSNKCSESNDPYSLSGLSG